MEAPLVDRRNPRAADRGTYDLRDVVLATLMGRCMLLVGEEGTLSSDMD